MLQPIYILYILQYIFLELYIFNITLKNLIQFQCQNIREGGDIMATASSLVQVKQEAADFVDIETKIVDLCKSNVKGIIDSDVKAALHDVSTQQLVKAINRLLSTVCIVFIAMVF